MEKYESLYQKQTAIVIQRWQDWRGPPPSLPPVASAV